MFDRLSTNKTVRSVLASAEQANRRVQKLVAPEHKLAQEFSEKDISSYFRPNGLAPPATAEYRADAAQHWETWRLQITGLIEKPSVFTLSELKAMPARIQITRHDCVEGWSAIAKWKGVPLAQIVDRVQPKEQARFIVFHCMDMDSSGDFYYESIDLHDAAHPQTILAYEMNDRDLPIEHGAPLRLRVENQLGYKHAKYIRGLEFVAGLGQLGGGKGGYWEDQGYEWYAGI
jgi:DMSO/TMAO reductase YedYZ molybdopterin-dependent catalytic subunit